MPTEPSDLGDDRRRSLEVLRYPEPTVQRRLLRQLRLLGAVSGRLLREHRRHLPRV